MRVRIVADGQVQIRRSPMIFVARSAYQLDQFGVVGAEAISDDRFAVYIARQTTRMGLLKLAWRLMRPGKVDLSDDLELLTPQTLVIDRPKRRRIRIAYDGEREKMILPLTFRIDHHVLVGDPAANQGGGGQRQHMTRILHISDLHFGAVNARLLEPLLELARHLQPDAVIVSGDLTQRARSAQFREAAAFLARFGLPVLSGSREPRRAALQPASASLVAV